MKKPTRGRPPRKDSDAGLVLSPAHDEDTPPKRIRKPFDDQAQANESETPRPRQRRSLGKAARPSSDQGYDSTRGDTPPSVTSHSEHRPVGLHGEDMPLAEVISGLASETVSTGSPLPVFRRVDAPSRSRVQPDQSHGIRTPDGRDVREGTYGASGVASMDMRGSRATENLYTAPEEDRYPLLPIEALLPGPPIHLFFFAVILILIAVALQ